MKFCLRIKLNCREFQLVRLTVKSSGPNTAPVDIWASDGSSLSYFWETSGGDGEFAVENAAGSEKVYLSSNGNSYLNGGNVGIGTTGPTEKLDVVGNAKISGTIRGATYGFGGMYTTNPVVSCSTVNPLTGDRSCPALFTAYLVGLFQHGGGIGACEWTQTQLYACIR